MRKSIKRNLLGENTAKNAWIAFGGLLALGIVVLTIREMPSIRREIRLMSM
jgi:hypothetical protein